MRRLGSILAVALLAVSCRLPIQRGRWNVVVVLVDTVRADHLGAYGYRRPTSPHFDALAAQSYLFTQARAQASCTYPSVNSLLTSRYPARFLGQAEGSFGIPAGIPTIGEMLAARGWSTAAVSASPVVRNSPTRFNPGAGFGRGFSRFDEACLWHPAACVTNHGIAAAEQLREPFFLYLHYMDPHGPYDPPQPFRKQFRMGRTKERWAARGDVNPLQRFLDGAGGPVVYGPADLRFVQGLYDGEIAYFDAQLGRLVDQLRRQRLLERTILVVLSDHGESFLEHGNVKHCESVYDSEVRIPLLVRLPRQHRGERIAGPVEALDLAPTLLDLVGLPIDGRGFEGRSLLPRLDGKAADERYAFSMIQRQRSVAGARYKLVAELGGDRWQLFDLSRDPGERRDVKGEAKQAFARLRAALQQQLARTESPEVTRYAAEADARLRALGYL
ncbi:MAG TPA: sulfatase [Thermoanaerobaculia bacterium]|jgi:arylsulfatase A-like enzyme|nr:sulfatase [Thermoanaerobaculia bacterium]